MVWETSIHALDDEGARVRWRALWETSPQRSCFSSLPYARAAAAAYGLECEMHLAGTGAADAAGALVFWRRRGPYREVVVPPLTQYTPLVLRALPAEDEVHARCSAFEALLAALEARFHRLCFFCHAITDVRPALWRGWRVTPYYTYTISLRRGGDAAGRWSSSTRRTFRKHAGAYVFAEDPSAAPELVRLCAAGYARHGRPLPAATAPVRGLIDELHAGGMVRLFTVTPAGGGTPEGGVALLHDGHTAHYWIAGSVPGPAMTVLLGHVLPCLRACGLEAFDFVGANTPSIAEFKRHFGPVLAPYFLLEKTTRRGLRLFYRLRGS